MPLIWLKSTAFIIVLLMFYTHQCHESKFHIIAMHHLYQLVLVTTAANNITAIICFCVIFTGKCFAAQWRTAYMLYLNVLASYCTHWNILFITIYMSYQWHFWFEEREWAKRRGVFLSSILAAVEGSYTFTSIWRCDLLLFHFQIVCWCYFCYHFFFFHLCFICASIFNFILKYK